MENEPTDLNSNSIRKFDCQLTVGFITELSTELQGW